MPCETKTEMIDDKEYLCTQYPATVAMGFKMELISVLGPAISTVLPIISDSAKNKTDQTTILATAVEKMFSSAKPQAVTDLIVRILTTGHTRVDGKVLNRALFDQVFSGDDLLTAYKVFGFVLRTNYANFLSGRKLGALLAKEESQ